MKYREVEKIGEILIKTTRCLILKRYRAGVEDVMTDLVVEWWRWWEFDPQP
jgi:hypothetical protein